VAFEEILKKMGVKKLDTKVTGSGPMASNRKRSQGSSRTVTPAEREKLGKM
jgi:hypothetical protein